VIPAEAQMNRPAVGRSFSVVGGLNIARLSLRRVSGDHEVDVNLIPVRRLR
jgi:hypothetical protein